MQQLVDQAARGLSARFAWPDPPGRMDVYGARNRSAHDLADVVETGHEKRRWRRPEFRLVSGLSPRDRGRPTRARESVGELRSHAHGWWGWAGSRPVWQPGLHPMWE